MGTNTLTPPACPAGWDGVTGAGGKGQAVLESECRGRGGAMGKARLRWCAAQAQWRQGSEQCLCQETGLHVGAQSYPGVELGLDLGVAMAPSMFHQLLTNVTLRFRWKLVSLYLLHLQL